MESILMTEFAADLGLRLDECRTFLLDTIAKIGDPLELESVLNREVRFRMEDLNRHFHAHLASLLSSSAEDQIEKMSVDARCVIYGGQLENQSIGDVDLPAWPGWRAGSTRTTRYLASAAAICCAAGAAIVVMASRPEPLETMNGDPIPESEFTYFRLTGLAFAAAASAALAFRPRLLSFPAQRDRAVAADRVSDFLEAVREKWMTAARSSEARFRETLVRFSSEYPHDESHP